LLSHLQWLDSNRHTGQMLLPQPTQVLVDLLHAQCLHSLVTIMNLHHHALVYENLFDVLAFVLLFETSIDYRRASGREPRYPQVLYPPTFYIIICDFNFFYSHITDLIAFLLRVFSYHRYYAPSSSRLDLENYQGGFQYLLLHHYY
jgi:hypothetical protein